MTRIAKIFIHLSNPRYGLCGYCGRICRPPFAIFKLKYHRCKKLNRPEAEILVAAQIKQIRKELNLSGDQLL